ncbi:RICIN domain-containing protein [Streptomyces sp. NPDC096153]|uniref:RICIN domain-containing protein n=1 Tax=Streptomyces sp. NPDC096153 TaxID=3155548 RepID=UPI00332A58A1
MRKAASTFVLAAVAVGTLPAFTATAQAAPQAKDPYAHTRLERVWAPKTCLSMGGSKKNNARLIVAKCAKSDRTQRWTLKRLSKNSSVFTIKNDKSGKCLAVGARSRIVQTTCRASARNHQWALGGSKIYSRSAGKVIASNSTKAGSHPYLEKSGESGKARGRQEWGLS